MNLSDNTWFEFCFGQDLVDARGIQHLKILSFGFTAHYNFSTVGKTEFAFKFIIKAANTQLGAVINQRQGIWIIKPKKRLFAHGKNKYIQFEKQKILKKIFLSSAGVIYWEKLPVITDCNQH